MCVRCDCEEVARCGLCVSMVSFLLLLLSLQLLTLWIFSFFFEFGWCAYLCNAIALSVAGRSRSSAVRRHGQRSIQRVHVILNDLTLFKYFPYSRDDDSKTHQTPAAAGAKFIIDHCNIFCTSTANAAVFYACERTCLVRLTYFSEWASVLARTWILFKLLKSECTINSDINAIAME